MTLTELAADLERICPGEAACHPLAEAGDGAVEVTCARTALRALCRYLFDERDLGFAGLIVEEGDDRWRLRYLFYGAASPGWVQLLADAPLTDGVFPSIVEIVHAADWHERAAEDLFGVHFDGHPRLGDFILHDDVWQEDVQPMRRGFDPRAAMLHRRPAGDWRPRRIVHETGAFLMPIGPKYSGVTESAHFQLETVGEDVIRTWTRLFYKWRAIQKLAEGRTVDDALLIAERFAATTAFAHGLAFCQAVERIAGAEIPPRAQALRVFLAELERLRHHAGAIEAICDSTALVVAASLAAALEEDLLRVSCELTGHRYLFGLLAPGGLLCDLGTAACDRALEHSRKTLRDLDALEHELRISSSFLDRLEDIGVVWPKTAKDYSLVGPVARASALTRDLRRMQPYSGYDGYAFDVPSEQEGDGYARLRVLFSEARQSVRIMEQALAAVTAGAFCAPLTPRAGAAIGWAEAPRGATFHWVRLGEAGTIARYAVMTPSFTNWHSFHLGAENFAFQDFSIILSTFDLSAAENDQ